MNYLRTFFLTALILTRFSLAISQTTIKGKIYEDRNSNNKWDKPEKGIPGVAVSNGRDVLLTDSEGNYELPVENDNIIFVIKPSGFRFPLNDFNQPQFYYIHKPLGSPQLEFEGVKPTPRKPGMVNFAMYPENEPDNYKILVFGDPQPKTREEMDFFHRGIVKEVAGIQTIEFGLSLGDLVHDDLELFAPYINSIKEIGVPWHNVIGNHDINFDAESDSLSDESFERSFGPPNYSFNYGKAHFIILDDILYPDPRDGKGYFGGFREDQFEFLKNDLKLVPKDHLIVLAFHIPISEGLFGDSFRDEDRNRLFELLKDFPHTLSLSAHTHLQTQHFFRKEDGWLQDKPHHHYNVGTTSGDWYSGRLNEEGIPYSTMRDGTPKGYAFLNIQENKYAIDYKVAGEPADYRIKIYAPKVVEKDKRTTAGIAANFFMGSEMDTLHYRIDKAEWKRMWRMETFDPAYFYDVLQWDHTEELFEGRRPSNPVDCSHIWFGRIPADLPEGNHTIEVRVKDMYGRTFTQKSSYRIATR